jgi:putative MFS transporter
MDLFYSFTNSHLSGIFYQLSARFILCIINLINGAFFSLTSIFTPEIEKEFSLTITQVSLLASTYPVGIMVGAIVSGEISRVIGRSLVIKIFTFIQLLGSLLIYLSMNFITICIIYFLFGIFNGFCINVLSTYSSEIAPEKSRGRWMVFLNSFLTLGKVSGLLLAKMFLIPNNFLTWRMIVVYLSISIAVCFPFVLYILKESLRYQIMNKRYMPFRKNFNEIIRINNLVLRGSEKNVDISEQEVISLSKEIQVNDSNQLEAGYRQLFKKKYIYSNILVWMLWISGYAMINGQSMIQPYWFKKGSGQLNIVTLTLAMEIPSLIIGFFIIDMAIFGRKRSLQIVTFMSSVCIFSSLLVSDNTIMSYMFMATRFSVKGVFVFIIPYTAEIYPTNLRSIGLGFGNCIGAIASFATSFIIFPLYQRSHYDVFILLGCFGLFGFIASLGISVDTTNQSLENNPTIKGKKNRESLIESDA